MFPLPEKPPLEELELLADLGEHLERAQKAMQRLSFPGGKLPVDADSELGRVFAVAQAALDDFAAVLSGRRQRAPDDPRIALQHSGRGVTVFIDTTLTGEAGRRDIAAFIADLRAADARLHTLAELLGLLLGLAVRWSVAGFAPPVIVASLQQLGPQILELGRAGLFSPARAAGGGS